MRADSVATVQSPTGTARIEPWLAPVKHALPSGWLIETGGPVEDSTNVIAALFKVFPVTFVV